MTRKSESEVVDLTLDFMFETEKAIQVTQPLGDKDDVWLPKSQIEYTIKKDRISVDVTLPRWLAEKKGLI